jgi:hypothetical protein
MEQLVNGVHDRVDRRELFFHVAEDLVNAMARVGLDDNPSEPPIRPGQDASFVTNKKRTQRRPHPASGFKAAALEKTGASFFVVRRIPQDVGA